MNNIDPQQTPVPTPQGGQTFQPHSGYANLGYPHHQYSGQPGAQRPLGPTFAPHSQVSQSPPPHYLGSPYGMTQGSGQTINRAPGQPSHHNNDHKLKSNNNPIDTNFNSTKGQNFESRPLQGVPNLNVPLPGIDSDRSGGQQPYSNYDTFNRKTLNFPQQPQPLAQNQFSSNNISPSGLHINSNQQPNSLNGAIQVPAAVPSSQSGGLGSNLHFSPSQRPLNAVSDLSEANQIPTQIGDQIIDQYQLAMKKNVEYLMDEQSKWKKQEETFFDKIKNLEEEINHLKRREQHDHSKGVVIAASEPHHSAETLNQLTENHNHFKSQLEQKNHEMKNISGELERLMQHVNNVNSEIDNKEQQSQNLRIQIDELKTFHDEEKVRMEDFFNNIIMSKEEDANRQIKQVIDERNQLERIYNDVLEQKVETEAQLNDANSQIEELLRTFNESNPETQQSAYLREIQYQLEILRNDLEQKNNDYDKLRQSAEFDVKEKESIIKQLNLEIHGLSEEMNELRANNLQFDNQVHERDLKLNSNQRELADLHRQLQISKNETKDIELKHIQAQEIQVDLRQALNSEKNEKEQLINQFQQEIHNLKNKSAEDRGAAVQESDEHIQELRREYEAETQRLHASLRALTQKDSELNEQNQRKSFEIDSLKREREEILKNNTTLSNSLGEAKNEIQLEQKENEMLKNQIGNLKNLVQELENRIIEVDKEKTDQIDQLRSSQELSRVSDTDEKIRITLEQRNTEFQQILSKELEAQKQAIEQYFNRIIQQHNEEYQKNRKQLISNLQEYQEVSINYQTQKDELERLNQQLNAELESLLSGQVAGREIQSRVRELEQQNLALKKSLDEANVEIQNAKKGSSGKKTDSKIADEVDKLKNQLTELTYALTALEQENRELKGSLVKNQKAHETEKDILKADYEEQIRKYQMSNDILMEEKTHLETESLNQSLKFSGIHATSSGIRLDEQHDSDQSGSQSIKSSKSGTSNRSREDTSKMYNKLQQMSAGTAALMSSQRDYTSLNTLSKKEITEAQPEEEHHDSTANKEQKQ